MSLANWKTVLNFIKTTSLEGLETIMVDVVNSENNFTDEQIDAIQALINKDDVDKAAARLSAAAETGVKGYDSVKPLIETATFEEMKKYVHALDTRLKSLPDTQRNQILASFQPAPLEELLRSLTLPPEGQYIDDESDTDQYSRSDR